MIGFVGLSHLGIVSSAAAAAKGVQVIGFDSDPELVARMKKRDLPIFEKDLENILDQFQNNISYTNDLSSLKECEIVYLSRDVPTNDANESDLAPIRDLISKILPQLSENATLVVLCQVPPGFMRQIEETFCSVISDKNISLVYQVETLIFGNAVERALHPERYIVGLRNSKDEPPRALKEFLSSFDCPLLFMGYESAELAKIAINIFLISSVGTTNLISEICESVGGDWSKIEQALRLDKRIGKFAYLKPGLGIAGGNLERDLVNLGIMARDFGIESGLIDAWTLQIQSRRNWILRKIHQVGILRRPSCKVALWGIAYKPGTHSLKNAPSLELLSHLQACRVSAYDPEVLVPSDARTSLFTQEDSALKACKDADALVIMTPWAEFSKYKIEEIQDLLKDGYVIDPHGVFNSEHNLGSRYITMGR